jgi:hypothetical protein
MIIYNMKFAQKSLAKYMQKLGSKEGAKIDKLGHKGLVGIIPSNNLDIAAQVSSVKSSPLEKGRHYY